MQTEHYYDVSVRWDSDRKGTLCSTVLPSTIEVATPPEFSKGMPGIWSPEHLLIAAVNSCLMTTFLAIAENSKLSFESFHSDAAGKLEVVDGKYMISEITLKPIVSVADEVEKEKAERVLRKSEAACLITNSVRARVTVIAEVAVSRAGHENIAVRS
jgi:peroxiredoxin-like protein